MRSLVSCVVLLCCLASASANASSAGTDEIWIKNLPRNSQSGAFPEALGREPKAIQYMHNGLRSTAILWLASTEDQTGNWYFPTRLKYSLIEEGVEVATGEVAEVYSVLSEIPGLGNCHSIPYISQFDVFNTEDGTAHVAMGIGQSDEPDQMMFRVYRLDRSVQNNFTPSLSIYDSNYMDSGSICEVRRGIRDLDGGANFTIARNPKLTGGISGRAFTVFLIGNVRNTSTLYYYRYNYNGSGVPFLDIDDSSIATHDRTWTGSYPQDFETYYDNSSIDPASHKLRFIRNESYLDSGVTKYRLVATDSDFLNPTTIADKLGAPRPLQGDASRSVCSTVPGVSLLTYASEDGGGIHAYDFNNSGIPPKLTFGEVGSQIADYPHMRFRLQHSGRPTLLHFGSGALTLFSPDSLQSDIYGTVKYSNAIALHSDNYHLARSSPALFSTYADVPSNALFASRPARNPVTGDSVFAVLSKKPNEEFTPYYVQVLKLSARDSSYNEEASGSVMFPDDPLIETAEFLSNTEWEVNPHSLYRVTFTLHSDDASLVQDNDIFEFKIVDRDFRRFERRDEVAGPDLISLAGYSVVMDFAAPPTVNLLRAGVRVTGSSGPRIIRFSSITLTKLSCGDAKAATNVHTTVFPSVTPTDGWYLDQVPTYYDNTGRNAIVSHHNLNEDAVIGIAHYGQVGLERAFNLSAGVYRLSTRMRLNSSVGQNGNHGPGFDCLVKSPSSGFARREAHEPSKYPVCVANGSETVQTFYFQVDQNNSPTTVALIMRDPDTSVIDNNIKWTANIREIRVDKISNGLPLAPGNDECSRARVVDCGFSVNGHAIATNATVSNVPLPPNCFSARDVWYKITIPELPEPNQYLDRGISVVFNDDPCGVDDCSQGSPSVTGYVAVYGGWNATCGNLQLLDWRYGRINGQFNLTPVPVSPGMVIYVRVASNSNSANQSLSISCQSKMQ